MTEMKPIIRERKRNISREQAGDASTKSKPSPGIKAQVLKDKEEREAIVLWRQPVNTLYNATLEIITLSISGVKKLKERATAVILTALLGIVCYLAYTTDGPHSEFIRNSEDTVLWGLYWVWLGVLSSVGLGTGLHTFLLFLGPFIARVTMAAHECGTTDFPEPPYPNEINCPDESPKGTLVSIFAIMSKVRFPAMCWGAGTALGELPPYFMARAARLTGVQDEDDEDLQEFQELLESQEKGESTSNLDLMTRGKLFMHDLVQRVGFFGILAAASIPNPLFDLAGITCGHFLVPFWTFFGATLIGKAVIKMHIQKVFIIFLFSKHHVAWLLEIIKSIPVIGPLVIEPIEKFFNKQQTKLQSGKSDGDNGNIIGNIFEIFIFVMVGYFIITILNSLAQSRVARIQKAKREEKLKK